MRCGVRGGEDAGRRGRRGGGDEVHKRGRASYRQMDVLKRSIYVRRWYVPVVKESQPHAVRSATGALACAASFSPAMVAPGYQQIGDSATGKVDR
jgi:hypothetical protein